MNSEQLKYYKKRRSNLTISDEALDKYFKTLVDYYTAEWLSASDGHPIQELWSRSDELSTHELFCLAVALKTLELIDEKWLRLTVDKSKSNHKNFKGFIFEILGLSMLNDVKTPIRPTSDNQAGYDGIMDFLDNTYMRLSLKNYGMSTHEQTFEKNAKEVEGLLVQLLAQNNCPPVSIVIDSPLKYPEKSDWEKLKKHLPDIIKSRQKDAVLYSRKNNSYPYSKENVSLEWTILIYPINNGTVQYHPNYKSYTLILSGLHHRNEHENLFSKMDDACNNLITHSAEEKDGLVNCVFMHIPPTASIEKCYEWLTQYFELFPDKPISAVILYQPSVATDIEKDISFIHHCIKLFVRQSFLEQRPGGLNLKFNVAVGTGSDQPATSYLIAEYPDGHKEKLTVLNRYMYQSGNHYLKMQPDGNGGFYGNIEKIGSGVFTHSVIEFPNEKNKFAIGGKFAPKDVLLIL